MSDTPEPSDTPQDTPEPKKIALEVDGHTYEMTEEEYKNVAAFGIQEYIKQQTAPEPEKTPKKEEQPKDEVKETIARLEERLNEYDNKIQQDKLRQNREKFSERLSNAVGRYPKLSENAKLKNLAEIYVTSEHLNGTKKKADELVDEFVSMLSEGRTVAHTDYVEDKRRSRERMPTTSGLGSGGTPKGEKKSFSAEDFTKGTIRKDIKERFANFEGVR